MVNLNEDVWRKNCWCVVVGVVDRKQRNFCVFLEKGKGGKSGVRCAILIQKILFVVFSRHTYFRGLLEEKTGRC